MRIIQPLGPSPRDDGAPFYLMGQLNRISGITCDRKSMLEEESTWGQYDAVVYVDWGQDNDIFKHLPEFTPNPTKRSLCWQSDTHWTDDAMRYRIAQAVHYKTVAFCQKNAADMYSYGPPPQRVMWLPHAADHTIYTPPLKDYTVNLSHLAPVPKSFSPYICDIVPRYDLCFVGYADDMGRQKVLDEIFRIVPNFAFHSGAFFRAASRIFHQSKIVFNSSVRRDLNMRTFEALATRSFLLTDRQKGMKEIGLTDGVHAAIYETPEEMRDKALWYLDPARDALRRSIAQQGWEWLLKAHTYWHRARTIVECLQ